MEFTPFLGLQIQNHFLPLLQILLAKYGTFLQENVQSIFMIFIISTVVFTGGVEDQQVGNLWSGEHLISLSLSGDFNYIDPRSSKKVKSIYGHQKAITAVTRKPNEPTFFTGSYDGRVYSWDLNTGMASPVGGNGHTNQVSVLTAEKDGCYR